MSNLRIQPGEILWLERNEETERLVGVDEGMLGHPVVILGIGVKGDGVEQSRHIQINIITSFGGQLLEQRHPGNGQYPRRKRSTYIPIHRPPWPKVPHPDSKQVLPIETVGNPKVPCQGRTSYLSLGEPIYVGQKHLTEIFEGKANLTFKALRGVVKRVNAICKESGAKQVPTPINRPRKPEKHIERQPPLVHPRIIELDSKEDSDSDSQKTVPNCTNEHRWCESCQHIHHYPTGQASTVIPGCRVSRVPPGQRNPNTAWESHQSPPGQRDPLLEPHSRSPFYGSSNGSGSRDDLEAAHQSCRCCPPERNTDEAGPTWRDLAAAAVIVGVGVGTGYLGYRMIDWVIVEGEWVIVGGWGALRGFLKKRPVLSTGVGLVALDQTMEGMTKASKRN